MPRRNKDPVWSYFECIKNKNTGLWAKCHTCGKEMQGIIHRLKSHVASCQAKNNTEEEPTGNTSFCKIGELVQLKSPVSAAQDSSLDHTGSLEGYEGSSPSSQQRISYVKDFEVIKTSEHYKEKIDKQIARFLYASNTPFEYVEDEEFKKLCALLRPGYILPKVYDIENPVLEGKYADTIDKLNKRQ